jgi:hypothetical protein
VQHGLHESHDCDTCREDRVEWLQQAVQEKASLDGARLDGASLDRASLVGAHLDGKPILDVIQVSGIGSAHRCTTMIVLPESEVIYCGCFRGSLAELEAAIEKTHAGNPKFLTQYRAAVAFLNVCREEARRP